MVNGPPDLKQMLLTPLSAVLNKRDPKRGRGRYTHKRPFRTDSQRAVLAFHRVELLPTFHGGTATGPDATAVVCIMSASIVGGRDSEGPIPAAVVVTYGRNDAEALRQLRGAGGQNAKPHAGHPEPNGPPASARIFMGRLNSPAL